MLTVDQSLLVELGLNVRTLSGEELNQIATLNGRYPGPSPKDLGVLVVAGADDGIVVTGDAPLRAAAEAEGLTVHGVLWMLDQLVEQDITAPSRSAAALDAMVQQGSRLPEEPIEKRLRRWRSS